MFDLMSGYTTTGLYLLQDLDHVSHGLNMWRHLLTFAGGQGIIVIALTFLFQGTAGAYKIYVGEGKDERLLPNVIQTARAIWLVSLAYLVVGSLSLWIVGMWLGQGPVRALLHAVWIFMAGWSTGGFAPQSYNTIYYHSLLYEVISVSIFVIGSFNFALHWAVWTGKRTEIYKNIEIISFFTTITIAMLLCYGGPHEPGCLPGRHRPLSKDVLSNGQRAHHDRIQQRSIPGPLSVNGEPSLCSGLSWRWPLERVPVQQQEASKASAWGSSSKGSFKMCDG